MDLLRQPAVIVSWIITVIAVAAAITFWAQGSETRNALTSELEAANTARLAAEQDLAVLREQGGTLEDVEARLAEARTATETARTDETAARERVEALTREAGEVENRLAAAREEEAAATSRITELQERLSGLEASRDELSGTVEQLTGQSEQLTASIAEAQSTLEGRQVEIEEVRGQLEGISAEVEALTATRTELQSQVEALSQENEALAADAEEARRALETARSEIAAAQAAGQEAAAREAVLRDEVASLTAERDARAAEVSSLQDENRALSEAAGEGAVASTAAVTQRPEPAGEPLAGTFANEQVTATFADGAFTLDIEGGVTVEGNYALEGDVLRLSGVEGEAAATFPLACELTRSGDTITLAAHRGSCLALDGLTLTRR